MMAANQSPTTQWRKRKAALGFVRVEVQVRKEDAPLLREVASALTDPARQDTTRTALREQVSGGAPPSFKTLLSSAPLEGIDLDRQQDLGRDVDL